MRYAIAAGKRLNVELLNYKKDGSSFWNQLDPGRGRRAFLLFASQIDISEYRKVQALEASEPRMLMEVDHRANNVLAIVDSIVRLSRADDATAYASAVQQRVQYLAQAHALHRKPHGQAVDVRKVIEAQFSKYPGERISIARPEFLVAPAVA